MEVQPTQAPAGRGAATVPDRGNLTPLDRREFVPGQLVFTIEMAPGVHLPGWFGPVINNAVTAVPANASPQIFQCLVATANLLAHTVRIDTPRPEVRILAQSIELSWKRHGEFATLRVPSPRRYELHAWPGLKHQESEPVDRLGPLLRAIQTLDPFNAAEEYVKDLVTPERGDPLTTKEVAERVIHVLREVRTRVSGLPVPTIAPGPDDVVGMTWQNAQQHISIEIFPRSGLQLFREDLVTGGTKLEEDAHGVSEAFLSYLRRFAERA